MDLGKLIGQRVEIEGQDVVLILDRITDDPGSDDYVQLVPAEADRPPIWVRESELESLKETHPDHAVYGLWHTLYSSGAIDPSRSLQVIPRNSTDGVFILVDEHGSIVESGDYQDEFFVNHAELSLDDASTIEVDPDQLRLPVQEALTFSEVRALRLQRQRRSVTLRGVLIGALLIATAVVDVYLKAQHESELAEVASIEQQLSGLRFQFEQLQHTRLLASPDQSADLIKLIELARVDHALDAEQQRLGKYPHRVTLSDSVDFDPTVVLPWTKGTRQQNGRWIVQWNERGGS